MISSVVGTAQIGYLVRGVREPQGSQKQRVHMEALMGAHESVERSCRSSLKAIAEIP